MSEYDKIDVRNKIQRVTNNSDRKVVAFKNQNYESLRNECLRSGRLFEDPLFPAVNKSIFYTQTIPYGTRWARPKEFSSKPELIVGNVDANDLDQGYLGNCWFVAGCAGIATIPELFDSVVPREQSFDSQYAGIFHFKFWNYGQWVDVVVDDRLPVSPENKLVFCSNKQEPNEFWAALLEKAYAKLCGNYENLDGGNTTDALIDMTGGISESFEIKTMNKLSDKNEIWQILLKSRMHKSLIGASIAPNPRIREARLSNGLVRGHAYTVTRVACIEVGRDEIKLVRVRNPWGNEVEWRGAWSDNSYEWYRISAEIKKELKYQNLPDGEFWISFDDFYRNFETLQFCDITPDAFSSELLKKQRPEKAPKLYWKLTAYHDQWTPGKSSGGSGKESEALFWTNPQFLITLSDVDPDEENLATVIIALMQKFTREDRVLNNGESCEEFIQFRLYRVLNENDVEVARKTGQRLYASQLERCGTSGPYINSREVTKRFRVTPGTYVIIPSCYDSGIKRDFLLRLYTETPINENASLILNDHKDDLGAEDIFFDNPKSLDDAFSSWANLMGGGGGVNNKKIKSPYDKSKYFEDEVKTSSGSLAGNAHLGESKYVANFKVYKHDAFDIYDKIDVKKRNRDGRF